MLKNTTRMILAVALGFLPCFSLYISVFISTANAEPVKIIFDTHERHPIPESYQLYNPTPHQRPTWDLTSIVWAIRSDRDYFDLSEAGKVTVLSDGETMFSPDPDGLHYYLQLDQTAIPRIQEFMTLLVSEPPLKVSD